MSDYNMCTKGVWDTTIPDITFDENGISSYYYLMKNLMEAYPRGDEGQKIWDTLVQQVKHKGKHKPYDCLIGVSGGTDSSYLLYLAKQYGLRPLAVNFDNGWSSDIAVNNIKKVTKTLDIDLETYVVNYEEIKDLNVAYMKASLPWIDIPTDLAIKAVLYKIAAREGIKYIFRGNDFRSEGSQPREWTYGDGKQLKHIHRLFGRVKLKTFPNYTIKSLLNYSLLYGIKSIYPFYYLDYQKKDAQAFLKKEFGWEYYGGHHFENHFTRFAIAYWLYEKFGIDKRKITLSAQIISGEITRAQAIEDLLHKPYNEEEKKYFLEFVLKKLDLSSEEFEKIFHQPLKNYTNYPSNYNYIRNLKYWVRPIFKKVFFHKPQSLFQAELRK